MDPKVVYGLVKRLGLTPVKGSTLTVFLNNLNKQSEQLNDSSVLEDSSETKLTHDANQEVLNSLKRLQIINLTRPILHLCIQVQTPHDLTKAKSAGVESIIAIPDQISAKLNSLAAILDKSLKEITDIKEVDAEELNKKFNLVEPPHGLEISIVLTLVVAATAMLAFVILKAENMLGSSEAYWGFLTAGIMILIGVNAIIINLIKVLRFKKNRDSIMAEAKRKYLENAHLKHSRLKTKIDDEAFQIQKKQYSKASVLKLEEIDVEEQEIKNKLDS